MESLYKKTLLKASIGDITASKADVVVNAANLSLTGGGGVDGAIHRAAGPQLQTACMKIRENEGIFRTGAAVITPGYNLHARYIVHTAGPIWGDVRPDKADQLLAACYMNSLTLSSENGARTVAFPSISTGAYGFPRDRAAGIAVQAVKRWINENPDAMTEVDFVCFDKETLALYEKNLTQ